jgi:hypothetical protein
MNTNLFSFENSHLSSRGEERSKKDKKKKDKKRDKKNTKKSEVSEFREGSQLTVASVSTAASLRESAKFKKESR